MTEITDNAERKFELWFFRDLTDTQRRMLFTLFGMPVHEITHQGSQRQVFKHVLKTLNKAPVPSSPGKVSAPINWEDANDPAVKLFVGYDVEGYVEEYEFCADEGYYTPNESEKSLLIDAIYGVVGDIHEKLRALVSSPGKDGGQSIEAAQITMGRGLVDVSRIEHEGRAGILFRPRDEHIPVGEEGELQPGAYWPVAGDVVIWIENDAGASVIEKYLTAFLPARKNGLIVSQADEIAELKQQLARFRSDRPYTVGFNDGWEASVEWKIVPDEMTEELLSVATKDRQVLAYENGRYYNAWLEFEQSEGGWLWFDEADSEPNPSHYCELTPVPVALASLKAKSPSSDRAASEGWQPIDTAPKDGRDVLLTSPLWFGDALTGGFHFGAWRQHPDPKSQVLDPTHFMLIQALDANFSVSSEGEFSLAAASPPSPQGTVDAEVVEALIDAVSFIENLIEDGSDTEAHDREFVARLVSALDKSPSSDRAASEGWQPIETAPTVGGFLAANSREVWAAWHYDSENWHAKYGSRGATHWRLLPAPPALAEEKGSGQ